MAMGNKHRSLAKMAIAASLTTSVLSPGVAFAQNNAGPGSAIHQVVNGPEEDPNMPIMPYALAGAPITWSPAGDIRVISFLKPQSAGAYLGFNEKGTWIRNERDRKVYVWNLKDRTLTLGAESDAGVPLNLRNPSNDMKDLIASATGHSSYGAKVANNNKGRNTPYIPPSVAGDGNAQHAGGEARSENSAPDTANSASASRQIKGSGASIKGGMLTFILDDPASPDNGKPVSLITGTWMGEDPKNGAVVYTIYVQGGNGSVSGTAMTGMAAEAMKRIMNASR